MAERIRFGVLGAGWFASRRHLPDMARHPEVEIAALCRRDPDALKRLQAEFGAAATYTDWRQMLAECPLDAVLIATPHALHFEQARAALAAGLHVLVEKPLAVRAEEARELEHLAARQGRTLSTALNPPFWAHCHRMRDCVAYGELGTIEAVDMFYTGNASYVFGEAPRPDSLPGLVPPTMYRADPSLCGGGYFVDGGSHLVSEVLWVTGLRASSVACQMDATPSDRRATVSLALAGGATATITAIGDSASDVRRVRNTFAGACGTLTVDGPAFETTLSTAAGSATFREGDLPPVPGPVWNFVDALRGRAPLFSPASHGAHVVEVVEAAYRSAATGQAERL